MARLRGDGGTGLIGMIGAVTIFFLLLLFAVHLLYGLHARTAVTRAATSGVRRVAGERSLGSLNAAIPDAEQHMRGQLGVMGNGAMFDWSSDGTSVSVRVQVDAPRFLSAAWLGPLASDHIDRTVTARVEELR